MIRVYLATGATEDFDADGFSIGTANDGRSLVGCLRLWKTAPGQQPEVVVLFAPGAWLYMTSVDGTALRERPDIGFRPAPSP